MKTTVAAHLAANPFRQQLDAITDDMCEIANDSITPQFSDDRSDTTSFEHINGVYDRDVAPSQHDAIKAEKARRADLYRKQVEIQLANGVDVQDVEITYTDIDGHGQYNAELTFVGAMVQAGVIDADDLS